METKNFEVTLLSNDNSITLVTIPDNKISPLELSDVIDKATETARKNLFNFLFEEFAVKHRLPKELQLNYSYNGIKITISESTVGSIKLKNLNINDLKNYINMNSIHIAKSIKSKLESSIIRTPAFKKQNFK